MKYVKYFLLLTFFAPTVSYAFLMFEAGGLATFTSSKQTETSNSITINHGNFIDPGVGFETRAGIHLPMISLGALSFINWESSLMNYKPVNQGVLATASYSNTKRRIAYGPTAIIHLPGGWRLAGEYLTNVTDNFTYAKPKSVNPYRNNDYLKGAGWGIGIGYELAIFFGQATFRKITFDKAKMRGINTDLPSTSFSKLDTSGIFFSFGLSFK